MSLINIIFIVDIQQDRLNEDAKATPIGLILRRNVSKYLLSCKLDDDVMYI